jgi:hypothetical protein
LEGDREGGNDEHGGEGPEYGLEPAPAVRAAAMPAADGGVHARGQRWRHAAVDQQRRH